MQWQPTLGAQPQEDGVRFRVWADAADEVEVVLFDSAHKEVSSHKSELDSEGYFVGMLPGLRPGARYMYRLRDKERGEVKLRPDPASRCQPEGVHGPSQVIDPAFEWSDSAWRGVRLEDAVIYEAHVGTFTSEGTFAGMAEKLPYLKTLGVTALEVMPIADFPGWRNWGYDGVDIYAPARVYGGPEAFKWLVDSAHAQGLAVILDVVYNHLGPDGNYLRDFSAHYFTSAHKTPWGDALNFADPHVREFFIENALYWANEYHVDGLRLDATHAIIDDSPVPSCFAIHFAEGPEHILTELTRRVRESLPPDRNFLIFAEDERNEAWLLAPDTGFDGLWADDFHHEVRSALAGDNEGYYSDYTGNAADIADTLNHGWFYRGQYSQFHKRPRGTDPGVVDPAHFVYCIQNHDQVGNRALGDRLNADISPAAYRAASALLLLGPDTPLIFQGQEWAADTPFLFFTDHNAELGRAITEGRRSEFAHFAGFKESVPDPQALDTFLSSKLRWDEMHQPAHGATLHLYKALLALRRSLLGESARLRANFRATSVGENVVAMRYACPGDGCALVVVNLVGKLDLDLTSNEITCPPSDAGWKLVLSTEDRSFGGDDDLAALSNEISRNRLVASGPVAVVLRG